MNSTPLLFCIGLLLPFQNGGVCPNEYAPCDFSSDFSQKLKLIKGSFISFFQ